LVIEPDEQSFKIVVTGLVQFLTIYLDVIGGENRGRIGRNLRRLHSRSSR
jgi:hypothetical protein